MKILGAGLPRTGTTTLHAAFELLGLTSTNRTQDVIADPLRFRNWHKVFDRHHAIVGLPAAHFVEEIYFATGCKVIVTTRAVNDWWDSLEWLKQYESDTWEITNYMYFGDWMRNKEVYQAEFIARNARRIENIQSKDLLMIDFTNGDGWEQLCKFLGLQIPDIEFPITNQRTSTEWIVKECDEFQG